MFLHAYCAECERHETDRRVYALQLLWKYSKNIVGLRLRYLQQNEGTEPRSVLVQDIPGVSFLTAARPHT